MLGAMVFALIATIVSLTSWIGATLMNFEAFSFLPITTGVLISGNVHDLSEFGLDLGVFFNWFVSGLPCALIIWLMRQPKDGFSNLKRK